MTRLKNILLAGTMVPVLALAPLASAFAQASDGERHAPGQPGGAPHGGAGAQRDPGPREAPHAPAAPPSAVEHAPAQERAPAPRAPAAAAQERAPAPRAPVAAPQERAPARAPAAAQQERPREAPHQPPAPHGEAQPPRGPQHPPQPAAEQRPATPPAARTERAPTPPPAAHAPSPVPAQAPAARAPGAVPPAGNRSPNALSDPQGRPIGTPPNAGAPNTTQNRQPGTPNNGQNGYGQNNNGRDDNGRHNGQNNNGNNNNGQYGNGNNGQYGNGRDNQGRNDNGGDRRGGIGVGGAAAIGAAAGFAGGFLAATGAQRLDDVRRDRRESVEDGRTYIREPGRTIVEDGDRSYIVHDENDRFRELGYRVDRQRRGDDFVDTIDRPDGTQILTFTDQDGRMLRRVRRTRDGREVVLIDNGYNGHVRPPQDDIVVLAAPRIDVPRERYDVDYQGADEGVIYDTFSAPPLQAPPQRYTLDQIRYSPDVRRYVRSVDINTINFDSGSWVVPAAATGKLQALAGGIKRTIAKDPNSVFLVEGYTDATGNPTDNLSLSDRRAQSVAAILSKDFGIPPENLTTQGYGQQNLKVNTQGSSAANRRVVVQNITPLLAAGGQPPR